MKIFVAGATGVIGVRLVPLLVQAGHQVQGMTRSVAGVNTLEGQGAEAVIADVYDLPALISAVVRFAPELVIHQLTDLPDDVTAMAAGRGANARMRVEGTDNLLAAAWEARATRFLAQSIAWDPVDADGLAAKAHLESAVLARDGVVVRYGQLYGPGTYFPDSAELPAAPRIQVDEAARLTAELTDTYSGVVTLAEAASDARPPVPGRS